MKKRLVNMLPLYQIANDKSIDTLSFKNTPEFTYNLEQRKME